MARGFGEWEGGVFQGEQSPWPRSQSAIFLSVFSDRSLWNP